MDIRPLRPTLSYENITGPGEEILTKNAVMIKSGEMIKNPNKEMAKPSNLIIIYVLQLP